MLARVSRGINPIGGCRFLAMLTALTIRPESLPNLGHRHAGRLEHPDQLGVLVDDLLDHRALVGGKPRVAERRAQLLDRLGRREIRPFSRLA
jgi:hypothetical protein